jgi:hypothetical protein
MLLSLRKQLLRINGAVFKTKIRMAIQVHLLIVLQSILMVTI